MIYLASHEWRKRFALRKQSAEPVYVSARARHLVADAPALSCSTSLDAASWKPTCRRSCYAIFTGDPQ